MTTQVTGNAVYTNQLLNEAGDNLPDNIANDMPIAEIYLDGTTGVANNSDGISSITDNSAGNYSLTLSNSLSDVDNAVIQASAIDGSGNPRVAGGYASDVNTVEVRVIGVGGAFVDVAHVFVTIKDKGQVV